ncbi:MAG: hypothetical protein ACREOO_26995 [bacterium]
MNINPSLVKSKLEKASGKKHGGTAAFCGFLFAFLASIRISWLDFRMKSFVIRDI